MLKTEDKENMNGICLLFQAGDCLRGEHSCLLAHIKATTPEQQEKVVDNPRDPMLKGARAPEGSKNVQAGWALTSDRTKAETPCISYTFTKQCHWKGVGKCPYKHCQAEDNKLKANKMVKQRRAYAVTVPHLPGMDPP